MAQPPSRQLYISGFPLAGLRTAELLVVASLRLWASGRSGEWERGLAAAGLCADAARDLDSLLHIVTVAGRHPLTMQPGHCLRLRGDEAAFLEVLSRHQRNEEEEAALALRRWLPAAAARLAFGLSRDFAARLDARGLKLAGAAAIPFAHCAAPSAHANRGLLLVH